MSWFTETIRDPLYAKLSSAATEQKTSNPAPPSSAAGIMAKPLTLPLIVVGVLVVAFIFMRKGA